MKRQILSSCLAIALVLPTFAFAPMTKEAQAISRYTSTAMSCSAVKSVVRNEGAVILRWTSKQTGNPLWGRFVRSSPYCDPNEIAVPASVPSASGSCTVKKCKRCDFDDRFGRFGRPFGC
jgi:hypothetical protein